MTSANRRKAPKRSSKNRFEKRGKGQIEAWQYLKTLNLKKRLIHGGSTAQGRRKNFRPLSTRDPIHLVLKSSQARGPLSFRHKNHRAAVENIVRKQARRWFVQVKGFENVGNHLHIEVKIAARQEFQKFLKSVTAMIARKVTGARRGHKFGRFWDHLAFTRVLKTMTELSLLRRYFFANHLEAEHGREAREIFLNSWYG